MSPSVPVAISVAVVAPDPFLRAGVEAMLRDCAEVTVDEVRPGVLVVAVDTVDDEAVAMVRAARGPVVLLASTVDAAGMLKVVEAGAGGVLRRREASTPHLASAVRAAFNGVATMPPDLLGDLFDQVRAREPVEPQKSSPVLSSREVAVLRMLADGSETAEIARALTYSVRTVTDIVSNVVRRLRLRNRAHAVAFALQEGLI